jgi:hypothetical protein
MWILIIDDFFSPFFSHISSTIFRKCKILGSEEEERTRTAEPVLVYGAPALIPRNEFRQHM